MIKVPGISAIKTRIAAHINTWKVAPPTPLTGGGTAVVYVPPTKQAPPNTAQAVSQALGNSGQLAENTSTGLGIGAGQSAVIAKAKIPNRNSYIWLGALGIILLLAYMVDRGNI